MQSESQGRWWLIQRSGVDATIADKSAYLSHVFGLRAAVSPTFTDTARSASHRSNTDSFRSTSSGSVVHMRTRPTPADNASGPNGRAGGQGGRPLVVRDLHQNIGIWKGMGTKDKGEEIGKGAASGGEEVHANRETDCILRLILVIGNPSI